MPASVNGLMFKKALLFALFFGWDLSASAAISDFDACALQQLREGARAQTAADILAYCAKLSGIQEEAGSKEEALTKDEAVAAVAPIETETRVQAAFRAEVDAAASNYVVSLYEPNYIMFTHDSRFDAEDSNYAGLDPDYANLKQEEMKYQVSVKFPVVQGVIGDRTDLFVAYTQTSWWQLFSDEGITSAPFRETNYTPELFLRHHPKDMELFGGQLSALDLSLVHQSNGRSESLSRSWNRVMGRAVVDYGDLGVAVRAWYRIPEDNDDDDNPDTEDYYGYGDVRLSWAPNRNTFGLMFRPGRKENGLELSWSRSITDRLRIYAQWWYGYGESMIDYDRQVNRVGVGFALNDWLQGPK